MSASFTRQRMRFSVERFEEMAQKGLFGPEERLELIEGDIIPMAPIGLAHAAATDQLARTMIRAIGDEAIVSLGRSIRLGNFSELQPDIILLAFRKDMYRHKHADVADVILFIEVSDSSLAFDRGHKLSLYARHGIREYWVIDVKESRVFVHREPQGEAYRSQTVHSRRDSLNPLALPQLTLSLDELFAIAD
jgi:Uma2 family endonuclease